MPERSFVNRLPTPIREWLEGELLAVGFQDYSRVTKDLESKLVEAGIDLTVSRSSVHEFGHQFEKSLEKLKLATRLARTIAKEMGDDEGAMNDALIRLVQSALFEILITLKSDDEPDIEKLTAIGRTIADLTKASVMQKKWQTDLRAKVAKAAENIKKDMKAAGLSDELADDIRRKILGIAPPVNAPPGNAA